MKTLPSLTGWRAVSILLVLLDHCVLFFKIIPPSTHAVLFKIFDGNLGVRFFFTISGFLITWLLLNEEKECGRVSFKNFYARRALRILPVYAACLLVMAVIQWTGVWVQGKITWVQLFTFTRDFNQIYCDTISLHFWSLSVEEQFYLVWPWIFMLLKNRGRIFFLAATLAVGFAFKIGSITGGFDRHLWFLFETFSPFLYLDSLVYGCAGAILLELRGENVKLFFERHPMPVFALGMFFIILPQIAGIGKSLQPVGFIFLMLQSVLMPQLAVYRFLNNRWMIWIGVLSYSTYIWQQLVFVLWPWPPAWFLVLPSIFLSAWLSYCFIEKPFLNLRSRFHRSKYAVPRKSH